MPVDMSVAFPSLMRMWVLSSGASRAETTNVRKVYTAVARTQAERADARHAMWASFICQRTGT